MKESLLSILPLITTLVFLLPAAIITIKKMWSTRFFMLFGIYGLMAAFINALDLFPINWVFVERANIFYNMLDIPFVMFMMYTITRNEVVRKLIVMGVGLYIFLQLVFFFREGMKYDALKISMGYGLGIVLLAILYQLLVFFRSMSLKSSQVPYIVVLCALLFDYGSFIIIYIFDYYVEGYNMNDNLLLYYISSIVSMLIASGGLLISKSKSPLAVPSLHAGLF